MIIYIFLIGITFITNQRLPYLSAAAPDIIKGVVIAKTNKRSDSSITLINVINVFNATIPLIVENFFRMNSEPQSFDRSLSIALLLKTLR